MYPNKDTFCLPGSLIGYLRYSFDSVCLSVKALTCFQGFVGIKDIYIVVVGGKIKLLILTYIIPLAY